MLLTDASGMKIDEISSAWDGSTNTCYLSFDNSPDGISVALSW